MRHRIIKNSACRFAGVAERERRERVQQRRDEIATSDKETAIDAVSARCRNVGRVHPASMDMAVAQRLRRCPPF